MAGIKFRGNPLKAAKDYLERLKRGAVNKIADTAALAYAKRLQEDVQRRYQQADYPRTPDTIATYSFGKIAGVSPERKQWAGKSLVRSGELMNSVVVRSTSTGYAVMIDPGATYQSGDPADTGKLIQMVAAQMEDPQPIIVKVTKPMLAYLHMLPAGRTKGAGSSTPSVTVGSTLMIEMNPKPIWGPASREAGKLAPFFFKTFGGMIKQLEDGRVRLPAIVVPKG